MRLVMHDQRQCCDGTDGKKVDDLDDVIRTLVEWRGNADEEELIELVAMKARETIR